MSIRYRLLFIDTVLGTEGEAIVLKAGMKKRLTCINIVMRPIRPVNKEQNNTHKHILSLFCGFVHMKILNIFFFLYVLFILLLWIEYNYLTPSFFLLVIFKSVSGCNWATVTKRFKGLYHVVFHRTQQNLFFMKSDKLCITYSSLEVSERGLFLPHSCI